MPRSAVLVSWRMLRIGMPFNPLGIADVVAGCRPRPRPKTPEPLSPWPAGSRRLPHRNDVAGPPTTSRTYAARWRQVSILETRGVSAR